MKKQKPDPTAVLRRAGPFRVEMCDSGEELCIQLFPEKEVWWDEDYVAELMIELRKLLNAPRRRRR